MTLEYLIDEKEAHRFKDYIANILNIINLDAQKETTNARTWEIRHPKLNNRFGAIYLGGDLDKVQECKKVAYIELRFFFKELKVLGKYDSVNKIKINRDDASTLLRFRFYEINYDLTNRVLKELHYALYID